MHAAKSRRPPSVRPRASLSLAERPLGLLALALLAVAVAYSASPLGNFVWDDRTLIVEEPIVRELQPIGAYFDRTFFGGPTGAPTRSFYRPLVTLSFAVDWQVWSGNPMGFHLTNLLLHLACVALVFGVGRRWGASPLAAAIASSVFGLLPRSTEAVAWIAGRTDLLATAFVLAGVLVHSFGRRWTAAALVFGGLLAKEVALAGLLALLAIELVEARKAPKGEARWSRRLVPPGVAAAAYLALRLHGSGGISSLSRSTRLALGDRLLVAVEALGRYGGMVLDPFRSRTQIGSVYVHSPTWVMIGILVVLAASIATYRWRTRLIADGPVLGAVVLVAIPIALVLHVVPLPLKVVAADRFIYLPAAGLAMGIAARAAGWSSRIKRVAAIAGAIFVPIAGAAAYARTLDWRDDLSLWTDASQYVPAGNSLPLVQLGFTLNSLDRPEDALPLLERARAIDDELGKSGKADPLGSGSREATAFALAALGNFDEARAVLEELRTARPSEPAYWRYLGLVHAMSLDFDGAKREVTALLARYPDDRDAATFLTAVKRLEAEWRSLPATGADDPSTALRRAGVLAQLGRNRDARQIWRGVAANEGAEAHLREAAAKMLNGL